MIVDPRPGFRALLITDATVTARATGGVYPLKAKQGETKPQLVYSRSSGFPEHTMDGPISMATARFQVDAWAKDIDLATALADAVKYRLDGYSGSVPHGDDSPQATVKFYGIFYAGRELEDYDETAKMFRVSRSFEVHYRERT